MLGLTLIASNSEYMEQHIEDTNNSKDMILTSLDETFSNLRLSFANKLKNLGHSDEDMDYIIRLSIKTSVIQAKYYNWTEDDYLVSFDLFTSSRHSL